MAKCRPSKWVPWAFVGAGLPLLAAYAINTNGLTSDINSRAASALSANEQTAWAKVEANGRDYVLQGTAPSQEALDVAVKTVAGTYGVRTLANTVQIVEPVKMTAPTVESINTLAALPEIKGTWNEGVATALAVTVAGATYKLGESPELTSSAGNWVLKPTQPLPAGSYDVTVESSDGKTSMGAAAPGKLVVEVPAPVALAAPTVENYLGNVATPVLKGTWPEAEAKTAEANLEVKVGETAYTLGKSPELTSDGTGNWQLVPSTPLPEGELTVMPSVLDKAGVAVATAVAAATAVVDVTPPAMPEIMAPTADAKWPYPISGKWAESKGSSLTAKVGDRVYTVNRGTALTSDGEGNFTFLPSAKFAPGSYDIDFTVNDAAGNSTVQTAKAAIIVPEPMAAAPAVVPATAAVIEAVAPDAKWPYAITGTWDEKPGHTLSAAVAGRTYVLGRGAALTSDGAGKFTFAPSAKFAPGSYDIDFTTNDSTAEPKVTKLAAAIVVPEMAPMVMPATAAVVAAPAADAKWPYAITGTWDEKPGHTLSASVNGRTYVLGRGAALTSDGAGKFSFAPSAKFAPGKYDVVLTTNDQTSESKLTVAQAAIVVPESAAPTPAAKVALPAPTVTSQLDLTGAPIIKGTWPNTLASGLAVTVDGRTYTLGTDANIGVRDGAWSLLPGTALKDGVYDVAAVATASDGTTSTDTTSNELEVDGVQPAAPTVMSMSGDVSPDHLSGTWDEAGAKSLKVSVPQANMAAELGAAGSPLTSDGAGNWRLALAQALAVGTYNIVAESMDSRSRVQTDVSEGEVVVAAKGAVVAPPAVYDCAAVMARIGNVFPIRFEYDLTDITKPFDLSVSQYAALLKDPRCSSLNVEVKGHADFKGTEEYNFGLSERRAALIVKMLEDGGVGASRLSVKALGETTPLDPAVTDEARMKNRRVEITVKQ
jgi:large repetitive protein